MFYSHLIIGLFSPKKYSRVERRNFLETYKLDFEKNLILEASEQTFVLVKTY